VYFQYKKNLYPRKLTNTNIISLQRWLICLIQSVLSRWIELPFFVTNNINQSHCMQTVKSLFWKNA
jgi:hypothetical protein